MTTKTAQLELNNPYAKYGLKRRPTFNEIVGLISENEKIYKPFPDRRATQFKNSPQGSFFDGADNLELLKEQQNRIMDRQMREMLMRRQTQQNGGTFHLQRHLQGTGATPPITAGALPTGSVHTPTESPDTSGFDTPRSDVMTLREAELTGRIQALRQQEEARRREVAERHGRTVSSGIQTIEQFISTPSQMPSEAPEPSPTEEFDEDEELIPASGSRAPSHKTTIVYNTNMAFWKRKDVRLEDLMFQLYVRGRELSDEEEQAMGTLPSKGKGRGGGSSFTKKDFILELIQEMINDGSWDRRVEEELLKSRIDAYFSRSKASGKGLVRRAFDAVGEAVIEGGKEAVKGAVVRGVSSALGV